MGTRSMFSGRNGSFHPTGIQKNRSGRLRSGWLDEKKISGRNFASLVLLANMPVRCNGKKNYAFIRNDNANSTYLCMFNFILLTEFQIYMITMTLII